MSRRQHDTPWTAAGTASEGERSADAVVRETGWVFNNRRGRGVDLASFVATGDVEVGSYLDTFGVAPDGVGTGRIVEIGSGIGRMTAGFTRLFGRVIACDLDAAFLERCRETVAQFGRPERLRTVPVPDGRTLAVADDTADVAFSYITLQHCSADDAIALTREAIRVTRAGGKVALNYRTWTGADSVLWPLSKVVRGLWRLPVVGRILARRRTTTRLGWQANRLAPADVLAAVGSSLTGVEVFRSPRRPALSIPDVADRTFEGVHRSHWWLVATVA